MLLIGCFPLWGGSLSADDDFNPPDPQEPSAIDYCRLKVSADPAEGADVSGSGKYLVTGGQVYISTNARNTPDYEYIFQYWTMNGERTSYSQNFWYTPVKGVYELVAHYEKREVVFDPEDPNEPSSSNIKRKYYLTLTSSISGACSFSMASGNKHEEGEYVSVYAYVNSGYQFDGWKLNGSLISTSSYVSFTMPSANSTLEACVSEIPFDPDNPQEPNGNSDDVQNATRKLVDIVIGTATETIDKTRVVFNEKSSLDYEIGSDASKMISNTASYQIYTLDSKGTQYSINERPVDNGEVPVGIIVKEAGTVTISATRLDCSIALIDKQLGITRNLETGFYTFTSVAGTIDNRFVLTTHVPDIVLGDANNDGKVTITDAVAIVNFILGNPSDNFNKVAANVNGDFKTNGEPNITITDAVGVVNIILNNGETAAPALEAPEVVEPE